MREILFRGFVECKYSKQKWHKGFLVESEGKSFIFSGKREHEDNYRVTWKLTEVIPETVGQLRHENKHGKYFDGDVYYHAGYGNEVVSEYCELQESMFNGTSDDIERIIGNIHDNPELMED